MRPRWRWWIWCAALWLFWRTGWGGCVMTWIAPSYWFADEGAPARGAKK